MKKLSLISLISFIVYRLSSATPAAAVVCNPILTGGGCDPSTNPQTYFNNVLSVVFSIFFIVAVLYFIWHMIFAGYHLMASEGEPKKWQTAKDELVWGFVGIIIVFSVFAVLKVVGFVLGIQGLQDLTIQWPTL